MPAPPLSRRYARLLLIPALLLVTSALRLSAQDIQPPDLWDIATGEQIPGADVLKTKDFGAIVTGTRGGDSPAARGGIREGDIVLGVDGMRVFGWREYQLARFRNPLSSTMTLLINHEGDLKWHKLHDLAPGRTVGIDWNIDMEQDRFADAVESLGLQPPDDKVLAALRMLPPRAAAAIDLWAGEKKASAQDDGTAWLQDFIDLYTAIQRRHYSEATAPAHQPPIPYFQRLEKFYLALSTANQPGETPPDVSKSGKTPEFYTLALPVPVCRPELGDLHFSDLRFKLLLAKTYANENRPDTEIKVAARKYSTSQANGLDKYLDKVKNSILDPADHADIPYNSSLVQQSLSRNLLVQQLGDLMKDQTSPDWPLDACAMIALKFLNGAPARGRRSYRRTRQAFPLSCRVRRGRGLR